MPSTKLSNCEKRKREKRFNLFFFFFLNKHAKGSFNKLDKGESRGSVVKFVNNFIVDGKVEISETSESYAEFNICGPVKLDKIRP